MKKILLSAIAILAITGSNAQKLKFGAKAGINSSFLSNSGDGTTKTGVGFLVGGFAEFKLGKLGLQPELFYSQEKGTYNTTTSVSIASVETKQDIKLSKINMPILLKYYAFKKLAFEFGPEFSYILKATSNNQLDVTAPLFGNLLSASGEANMNDPSYVATVTGSGANNTGNVYQNYGLNKFNVGITGGLNLDLIKGIFVDLRYNYAITKFSTNANLISGKDANGNGIASGIPNAGNFNDISLKNSTIQFSVGYKF